MTREQALKRAIEALQQADIEDAVQEARLLLAAALEIPRLELLTLPADALSPKQQEIFDAFLMRRVKREPLARIQGKKDFWKHEFILNEATLEPRPDTETLIEAVLAAYPDRNAPWRILDIGAGAGCILISLLDEYKNATGVGTDISARALVAAKANANNCGVARRAEFMETSWAAGVKGPFDLLVSNPPYIASSEINGLQPEVALYDPKAALDGGADGLVAYREILKATPTLLPPRGKIFLEIGAGQETDVIARCATTGLKNITSRKDLGGIVRVISVY